jgi:signal transduction histidine kinase/phage shock protein PspC (stress-responsive transcriptional regulator)
MTDHMPSGSAWVPRRAARDTAAGYLGGVAAGLAEHLALPVLWIRVGFLVGAVFGGLGIAMYAALWLALPAATRDPDLAPGLAAASRGGRRPGSGRRLSDVGPAIALAAIGFGALLLLESVIGRGTLFWVVALGLAGVALIWRQADEAQRERWRDSGGRIDPVRALIGDGGWAAWARLVSGGALVLTALVLFALRSGQLQVARDVLIATLLGLAGLLLTLGPWVIRLATDLSDEREKRVRTEERADVAAHLHDSVLQTLALIQKNAADPAQVSRLARAQERDLRTWLFEGDVVAGTLTAALAEIAADVEAEHAIAVEVVTVGDLTLTEREHPVVLATREAVVNAARHSGASRVDVYAEVAGGVLSVYVKDRGVGFDPAAVAGDRQGVRGSIVDRMVRHGGTATITSAPATDERSGTEIVLRMPLEEKS